MQPPLSITYNINQIFTQVYLPLGKDSTDVPKKSRFKFYLFALSLAYLRIFASVVKSKYFTCCQGAKVVTLALESS